MVISQATYELVRGWFLVAPLGEVELKGLSDPVTAFQVVEEMATDSRVQARADLSPFVGRAELVDTLHRAWGEVQAKGSRAILLRGQPGVGKSRLADLLRRQVEADEGGTLSASCSAYHGATVLFPLRRLLERVAGIDTHQAADRALPRLWSAMEAVGQAGSVPLLAELLDLPPASWSPAPELDGARRHDALLEALVSYVAAAAARRPSLLVIDDVQWADPSTMALIGRIIAARVPGLFVVLTAREELQPAWPSAEVIEVDRLSADELRELAQRLPESRGLTAGDVARAIERSDGIPFFLEELLRSSAVAQPSAPERTSPHIPAVLRDLLLARFAAPGVDLRLAQLVATIGGEASAPLVAAVVGCPTEEVATRLAPMLDASILVRQDGEPATYHFRHHLLAELAYDTQLREARERAHGTVADALRQGTTVGVTAAAAVVARHLERAGRIDEALEALIEAAHDAYTLGANEEVGELVVRGLELVPAGTADRRDELEFRLRFQRGTAIASTLGFSAPQAVADFEASLTLAESATVDGYIDDMEGVVATRAYDFVAASTALWANLLLQGRIADADVINRGLLGHFRPDGSTYIYTEGVGGSFTQFFRGEWAACRERLEVALLAVGKDFQMHGFSTMPNDTVTSALTHLGFAHAVTGRLDDARAVLSEALEHAQTMAFPVGPFTACYALAMRSAVELMYGEIDQGTAAAAQLCALADRHGFTFWSLFGGMYQAMAEHGAGDAAAGERAAMMVALLRAAGTLVWVPTFDSILAEDHLAQDRPDAARPLLEDAMDIATQTGACFWSAEVQRQRGEVALATGEADGLDRLRAAAELAAEQGAALFELRARTAVCRAGPADDQERARLADLLARLPLAADARDRRAAEAVLGAG
jgi:hypothetical protein